MSAARNPLNNCPYWVGDILTTMSEIQPAQRWPGTSWLQITDCMLRAADESHPAGSTGGAWEVVQTEEQVARHAHVECAQTSDGKNNHIVNTSIAGTYSGANYTFGYKTGQACARVFTESTGQSQPMPIVNKYTAYYMWQRTG